MDTIKRRTIYATVVVLNSALWMTLLGAVVLVTN